MDIEFLVFRVTLGLMKNARLISKKFKLTKAKNEKALTLHQYLRMTSRKKDAILLNARKKENTNI